jgi:TP901-1 family phage major tail protein
MKMPKFNIFDLQRFAVTLPVNQSTSSATVGKDYLLKINTGTVMSPVWTLIGGQRGSSLGRTADSIDLSHKTSGGWKSMKAGLRGWSIDLDGLVLLNDLGLQALEQAFMSGVEVNLRLVYPDDTYQEGWGSITDFSMDTPHDGEASLSGTIEGNGPLTERIVGAITPLTATMSLAAAADKSFTISPAPTAINVVKMNDVALTITADYTYSGGTLVLKSGYLDGLAIGTYIFVIDVQQGNDLSVAVTITA